MRQHREHAFLRGLAGLLSAVLVLGGCGSHPFDSADPPTIAPATPADSPPVSAAPAGVVRPSGCDARDILVAEGTLVILCPDGLTRLGGAPPIALPGPASAMTGDGHGHVYVAARGGYLDVDLAAGRATQVPVSAGTDFTAIARLGAGRLVLGGADGAVYLLADGAVTRRNKVAVRVDDLAVQDDTILVLDRSQTSVIALNARGDRRQSLRAGFGATTLATDPIGVVLAADTGGGQLLVYGVDPLILRQAYPVPHAPYGVAGSTGLAWVSQTETNTVVGYELNTGIPVEKVRYPTVRQPNLLAFDDASGTLYVVGESAVQIIEHAVPSH